MKNKQAKDFLVQQVAEQASRENISFSDIGKEMMYFTESDPGSCDNPVGLNERFEAEYDTAAYEAKMSRLLHHACDRLKAEDPEGKRNWDEAIRTLRRGDHYLLVLWDVRPRGERPKGDTLKLLGTALLVIAAIIPMAFWAARHNIQIDRPEPYIPVLFVLIVFLALGFRRLYTVIVVWFHRGRTENDDSNWCFPEFLARKLAASREFPLTGPARHKRETGARCNVHLAPWPCLEVPSAPRMFIDFRLRLRLHARN